ncbi:hypothetical protein ACTXT7_012444 [Hymenolepis weldensis]
MKILGYPPNPGFCELYGVEPNLVRRHRVFHWLRYVDICICIDSKPLWKQWKSHVIASINLVWSGLAST